LFSVTKLMKQGWTQGGDAKALWLDKGDQNLKFDIKIDTPKGMLFAIYIKRNTEITGAMQDTSKAMMIENATINWGTLAKMLWARLPSISDGY
jgi:hypothetical protein